MDTASSPGTWRQAWAQPRFRAAAVFSLLVLLANLFVLPGYFQFLEQCPGAALDDPVLRLLPPVDFSGPIFLLIYCALFYVIGRSIFSPGIFICFLSSYALVLLMRVATLYLTPLAPPAGLVPMPDPLTPFFSGAPALTIEGFGQLPVIATSCNLPYMPRFVEKKGYGKKMDCFDFLIVASAGGIPAHYSRIFERIKRNAKFRLLEFESRKQIRPYIVPVFELVNETCKDIYGFQPLDDGEIKFLVGRYLPLLNPRYVKMAADETGKVIAFFIGVPNMTKGIQRAKGKLFPFGFLHILASARKTRQLDLLLGAIDNNRRGKGIDILMAWPMIQSARQAGIETLERRTADGGRRTADRQQTTDNKQQTTNNNPLTNSPRRHRRRSFRLPSRPRPLRRQNRRHRRHRAPSGG